MGAAVKFVAIALVVAALAIGAFAQTPSPQTPAGMPAPGLSPPTKSVDPNAVATVHGRVTTADAGRPIRGARVELYGSFGRNEPIHRNAITDREGRYRFENLPPGAYDISAWRHGFVNMRAGQKHPNDRATRWNVGPGMVQQLDFSLPRGSVIIGRLTDDTGEPLPGVQLTPLWTYYSSNGEQLRGAAGFPGGQTDDRGEFRLAGLNPGTYVIAATYQTSVTGESYATTYYPGTTDVKAARRFRIGLSEEVTANFSMLMTRQVRVTGQARSSTGEPLKSYRVMLRTDTMLGTKFGQVKDAAGTFEIVGVPPGAYTLDITTAGGAGMTNASKETEFASVPIQVGTEDVFGLLITTGHGANIRGRVTYAGRGARSMTPQRARVFANPVNEGFGLRPPTRDQHNGIINEDGSFTITGAHGKLLFRVDVPGWQLQSVTLDGVDITDTPYDANRGGTDKLEIVVTDLQQVVTGIVSDALGRPASSYTIVTFPASLKDGVSPGRFITTLSWDGDGAFSTSLPPGDYLIAALQSMPDGGAFDPDFREAVRPRATPVRLLPGETAKVELTLLE